MTHNLATEISEAIKSHGDIEERYRAILRDLEAVKSEISLSHQFIMLLKQQKSLLDEENARLEGLMHPVRSCPEEILQFIFEWAIWLGDPDDQFMVATNISHVCQRWRKIALRMSRLWTQIDISLPVDDNQTLQQFLRRSNQRLRNVAPKLRIKHLQQNEDVETLDILGASIRRFNVIDSLELQLSDSKESNIFTSPCFRYHKSINELIISTFRTSHVEGQPYNISFLLQRFPRCNRLAFSAISNIRMIVLGNFENLRSLEINCASFHGPSSLSGLINLEELSFIALSLVNWNDGDEIHLPNLRRLHISYCLDFPWRIFNLPKVESFTCNREFDDIGTQFIIRCTTILHLNVILTESSFKTLAFALPQLESLAMAGFIGAMFHWQDFGLPSIPFPTITELTLRPLDSDMEEISTEEFEGLVRERCLSPSKSNGEKIQPIKALQIADYKSSLKEAPWLSSDLLKDCHQTLIRDEECEYDDDDDDSRWILRLSWD